MRDFRDAKAMAQTLRGSLSAKSIDISHSESLELVSKMFGIADWNTLSAKIESGGSQKLPAWSNVPPSKAERRSFAIPMRDLVPFPGATYPVFAGRPKTIQALTHASQQQREVVIAIQKNPTVDAPTLDDIYDVGVLGGLRDLIHLHDGTVKALVQIHRRVAIKRFMSELESYVAMVEDVGEGPIAEAPELIRSVVARFARHAEQHNLNVPQILLPLRGVRDPELIGNIVSQQTGDPGWVADMIAGCLQLSLEDKQKLLATLDPVSRLEAVRDKLED